MLSRLLRAAALGPLIIAALVGPAAPAIADNLLDSSTPADGATLTEPPAAVVLTFTEQLDPATTTVTVKDPDLRTVSGAVQVAGTTVTVPVTPGGPEGEYRVNYRVGSVDGHTVADSVRFTVRLAGAANTSGAPAPAAAPVERDGRACGVWCVAGLLAVVALLAGAAVVAVRQRSRVRT